VSVVNDALEYRLSGGAANSDQNAALGGAISSNQLVNSATENLFANASVSEADSGATKYRCIYLYNAGAGTITEFGLYIGTPTPSPSTKIFIGKGSFNSVEQAVATEDTAPANITFTYPLSEASALSLPDLAPGDFLAIWIRRDVTGGAEGAVGDYARIIPKGIIV
jgi:hypothetical protein